MIRLTRCHRPDHAREYFELHLAVGDNPARPAAPSVLLPAAWSGPALRDVGLSAYEKPAAAPLVRLCRGLHPIEKTRLAPSVNRTRAYYDLTVAAPKTISLAALLEPNHLGARSVTNAHEKAVEAVIKAVGTMLAPQSKTAPKVAKWLGAVFHHTHTREGDPHLHSHLILPNIMKNERGDWRAMQVNIAGMNRTRLELIYGHELARQLRRYGLGSEIVMRPNGLPELRALRKLSARFSQAKAAVLAAAKAAEAERLAAGAQARKGDDVELHRRSRLPVPADRAAMRRRQWLADKIRKPKPKDADDPVRLSDEAARWMRALNNLESRELSRLLDQADSTNPRRPMLAQERTPPDAAKIVRAAYRLLPYELKPTAPLLLRASVQQSAGRHAYEELRVACNASLRARWESNRKLLIQLNAESDAIASAEFEAAFRPLPGPRIVVPDHSEASIPTPTPTVTPTLAVQSTSAPTRSSGRGTRR